MKFSLNFILATTILLGCSRDKSTISNVESNDTKVTFRTLGEQEQYLWTYFQEFEKQLENDPEIKKERIPKIIQILIDEGNLETPVIFVETEKGTESKIVDYLTYKEFRKSNPIDLKRQYVVSLGSYTEQDSLYNLQIDSIRTRLLKELNSDTIPKVQND